MKGVSTKARKRTATKADKDKDKNAVFIGARKSGKYVTVSREVTKPNGQFSVTTVKTKLPKATSKQHSKGATKDWLQDPQLGDRLTSAFGKAVAAAKRAALRSAKLHA